MTCRQRPSTAKGVVFLGITGQLESQQGVAHLIADHVWVPRLDQPVPTGGSRDFR